MFRVLKAISAILLAILVLITTGGFNIYSHDCDCCGTSDVSLVGLEVCCNKQDQPHFETVHHQTSSCCEAQSTVVKKSQVCHADKCCQIESTFYKLDYLFEKSQVSRIYNFEILAPFLTVITPEILVFDFVRKLIFISDSSPPKISARDIVIFGKALKISF